jgi:hypothetical protein
MAANRHNAPIPDTKMRNWFPMFPRILLQRLPCCDPDGCIHNSGGGISSDWQRWAYLVVASPLWKARAENCGTRFAADLALGRLGQWMMNQ